MVKNLLMKLGFRQPGLMPMHCDNQFAIYIAHNPVFNERTNHIEIDCHVVRDAWTKKVVTFQFTPSSKQLADLLTKAASPQIFSNLCNKLGMLGVYALASGGVLSWVINIELLGYPYTLLVFYIYLLPMNKTSSLLRDSISLQ